MTRSISSIAISGFVRAVRLSSGTRARAMRSGSSVQLSGRNSRRPTITGTSRDANVNETSDWQLAGLPERRGILRRDADRMLALFRQCRVVDDQPSLGAPNQPVAFSERALLKRRGIPHAAGDEVMKLVVADLAVARRHGLDALAITSANQPRNINRAHPCPRVVSESAEER